MEDVRFYQNIIDASFRLLISIVTIITIVTILIISIFIIKINHNIIITLKISHGGDLQSKPPIYAHNGKIYNITFFRNLYQQFVKIGLRNLVLINDKVV